jgi:hypothetical protein
LFKAKQTKVAAAPSVNPWAKKDSSTADVATNVTEFPTLGDVASGKVKLKKKTEVKTKEIQRWFV